MHRASLLVCVSLLCAACGTTAAGTVGDATVDAPRVDAPAMPDSAFVDAGRTPDVPAMPDVAPVSDRATPVDAEPLADATPLDVSGREDAAPVDSTAGVDAMAVDVADVTTADSAADVTIADSAADVATADGADAAVCPRAIPACDAAPPTPGAVASWRHFTTRITVAKGSARHRGRDLFLRAGDAQWALAKFAYGVADDDLNDEDVEVYLLRDCSRWESLGTFATSLDASPHATVYGVSDTGGRLYVPIPESQRLGVGTHRVHFVVRGDHTVADALITVLPADARVVVTDVDGTQTESETAAFVALLTGPPPASNAGGAEMLAALADRGYYLFYLTARPEWLAAATHDWLTLRRYPPGLVHTTLGLTGATGTAAATFKTAELSDLATRFGRAPDYAFGNTDSDVTAYATAGVALSQTYSYRYTGDTRGGQHVEDYTTLVSRFRALPLVCR